MPRSTSMTTRSSATASSRSCAIPARKTPWSGGRPANFLDVGGGATSERVTAAFELILSNTRVRAVLVNIFGGIVRCDLIAEGVINAVKKVGVKVPVVVRLEGTNAEQARSMLAGSGLSITPATDLTDAARKAVALAKKGTR